MMTRDEELRRLARMVLDGSARIADLRRMAQLVLAEDEVAVMAPPVDVCGSMNEQHGVSCDLSAGHHGKHVNHAYGVSGLAWIDAVDAAHDAKHAAFAAWLEQAKALFDEAEAETSSGDSRRCCYLDRGHAGDHQFNYTADVEGDDHCGARPVHG